jgi:hypothetical protein
LLLILFLHAVFAFCQQAARTSGAAPQDASSTPCSTVSLPAGVQKRLSEEFKSWSVQLPDHLSTLARERWKSEKPLECPGIAAGHFEQSKMMSFALLLVSREQTKPGYKFIIFTPAQDRSSYEMTVLDESSDDAADVFIHRAAVGKFFDRQSLTKFQVEASELVLFADAGEKSYETDVYFWGNGRFQHQPVDY